MALVESAPRDASKRQMAGHCFWGKLRLQGGSWHPEALELIEQQERRGNIRQLEQAVRLAVALADQGFLILRTFSKGASGLETQREIVKGIKSRIPRMPTEAT